MLIMIRVNTAFYDDYLELVHGRKKILKNYKNKYLFYDVIAILSLTYNSILFDL